jgi:hypothetical protein
VLGSHQLIETVYQLVSRTDADTRRFLRDVIVLAVHANPDGHELVANWYMREREPSQRSLAAVPRAYQKYVGHDNNRDFYLASQAETINMSRVLYKEWFPQIVYDHHQTGPAGTVMFAPPFRDPFNYVLDPLIPVTIDLIGGAMHARFAAEGKPGVTMRSGSTYSTWWNGGLRTTAYFHNQIGLLTETIGNPTPVEIPFVPERQLPSADLPYPIAPQRWRFRQSIDYSLTANWAVLDFASRYKDMLLSTPIAWRRARFKRQSGFVDGLAAASDRRSTGRARCGIGRRVRAAAACAAVSRSARLHSSVRSARLPDCHEVRRCAAQGGRDGAACDGAVQRRRAQLSGRLVCRQDGAGVSRARARHVRAAGSSRRHSVSGWAADGAVRHRRVDARVSDGREVRSSARCLLRSIRNRRLRCAVAGTHHRPANPAGYLMNHYQNDAFIAANRLLKAARMSTGRAIAARHRCRFRTARWAPVRCTSPRSRRRGPF